jgi:aminotransferase in exopolysaccharide biosynthesis
MVDKYKAFVKFVREIYNESEGFIPLHEPRFRGNEKKYVNDCIDSTFVSSVGKYVNMFEEKIAEYTGAKYAVAAVNGTAALHIALLLSGVKRNDEVITQSLTFVATANAISYTGASPVFVDVDKDTFGLSPQKLSEWLELNVEVKNIGGVKKAVNKDTGKVVSACVPMHTFGHPCRIDEIIEICDKYNIAVIEDAAESLGSYYKNKHTGTFGKFGTLSFNGNKTITTGGGGMILTDDIHLAKIAKHITTTAKVPHKWEFVHDMRGFNYRLTNIAAALGVAQIEQLPGFIESKRKLAEDYSLFFDNLGVNFINEPENAKSNYWLNAVLLKDRKERDEFLEFTNDYGVMTRPVWELMNRLPMFKNSPIGDLTNSEWLADRLVNIPSSVI